MAFEITQIDRNIISDIVFKLDADTIGLPRDGAITVPGKDVGMIPFQFPPRITSDSKDNKWDTLHDTFAWEPLKMFKGSNCRKLNLHAAYFASGSTINNVLWTPENLAITARAFKQYFYTRLGKGIFPAIELVLYEHIPVGGGRHGNAKFRMLSVNVKPGKELMVVNGSVFPLSMEIDITLEQVTRIVTRDGEGQTDQSNIPPFPPQAWY